MGDLIPFAVPFDTLVREEGIELARLDDDPVHEAVVYDLEVERLRRELQSLAPSERRAVCLAYGLDDGHECTVQEVADRMGVSVLAAARLQFAGMHRLTEALNHEMAPAA